MIKIALKSMRSSHLCDLAPLRENNFHEIALI